ncbi:hypothetical protein OAD57_09210 [Porticoccaceae bacterium]|nr:hypothetical protein [Porticoccaceae bacterium]
MTDEMYLRYQRAQVYFQAANGSRHLDFNTTVAPHWMGGSECFWYTHEFPIGNQPDNSHNTQDKKVGKEYRIVNAVERTNEPAFDHGYLAKSLGDQSGETMSADNLPFDDLEIDLPQQILHFNAFGCQWQFDLIQQEAV